MKKENTAKGMMAIAMFIFGTLAPFVRNIGVSSGELALYRALMAAVLVGGYLLITKQGLNIAQIKRDLCCFCYPVRQWDLTGYCCLKHTNTLPFPWQL